MADQAKTTPRGFAIYADFEQRQYPGEDASRYTVQESSLASERRVWVGVTNERAHLTEDEARTVRDALTEFLGDGLAHDAQTRAEALREAAAGIESAYPEDLFPPASSEQLKALHGFAGEIGIPDGSRFHVGGIRQAMALLRAEADRIADTNQQNGSER